MSRLDLNTWRILKTFFYYQRFWNAVKISTSYFLSKLSNKTYVWGLPYSIAIEPTTACNLRCPHCPSGLKSFSRDTGKISVENFEKYVDDIHKTTAYLTLYFQGEPYLNPRFYDLVKYARKKRLFVATSTNAHFLDKKRAAKTIDSGINQLIISIDGLSQETYQKYRLEGHLDKVIEGTKNLVEAKRKAQNSQTHIIWQFIVFAHNEHEVNAVKKEARRIGVDEVRIKSAQIYDDGNSADWLPEDPKYRRYDVYGEKLQLKASMTSHCKRLWTNPVVTWDGNVVPCCFDKDAEHQLGNLGDKTFKEIWNGKGYKDFRTKIKGGRKNIDICSNCSEGLKVWL